MHAVPLDEQSIFHVAVQIPSVEARTEYLSQVCGDNMALFDRLSALLHAHDERPEFLESPPPGLDATIAPSDAHDDSGTKIGPYKLLQQIGEGGFGVVYMAEQIKPVRRKVALKVIKPGMDTKEVVARFEAERQAVALMDHPNIARILDAGTTDAGRPYFVMELVKGVTVTEYCDTNNLSTRDRLTLFSIICRAVQHAHQKGVIHRDLKPSNVLVTLHDGKPVPKIIDFGVAKALTFQLTDKTMFTRYGQVIGTPQYMSPEQAEISGLDVDTRSDIYSLGVLLYELLTGRPPFEGEELKGCGIDEMRRLIREKEPVVPSHMIRTLDADTATTVATQRASQPAALSRLVQGELDWIVMKALDKDRNRRYETANSLAEDVDRYLLDDAVLAGPPSTTYRMWKTVKRHRAASWSVAAISLSLVLALVASLVTVGVVNAARKDANDAKVAALEQQQIAVDAAREARTQRSEAEHRGQQARVEAHNANQTLGLVLDILSKAKVNPQTGQQYTVQEALDDLASNLQNNARLPSATVARLHLAIGKAYYFAGRHVPTNAEQARKHLEKSRALSEKEFGPNSLVVARSLRYLGALDRSRDKLLRAVTIERTLHANTELSKTLTLLGGLMHRLDKLDEAEKYLRDACDLFVPSDPTVALEEIPFLPLAHVLREQHHVKESRQCQSRAIAVAKALFGTDRYLWQNQKLTFLYLKRHLAHEYVNLVSEELMGTDAKPRFMLQVARAFRHVADYDGAERRLVAAEQMLAAGNDPLMLAVILSERASIRCDVHDFLAAGTLQRQAVEVWDNCDAPDPTLHVFHHFQLGFILLECGRVDETKRDEAKRVFSWVVEQTKRYNENGIAIIDWDSNDKTLLPARINSGEHVTPAEYIDIYGSTSVAWQKEYDIAGLGIVYQKNGLDQKAMETFETAARVRSRIGRDEGCFEIVEPNLLELYIKHDQLPRANKFFTDLVAARDMWLPMNHPNRAFMRILLARVLILEKAELDRAKTLLREARKILAKHALAPDGPKQEIAQLLAQIDQASDSNE